MPWLRTLDIATRAVRRSTERSSELEPHFLRTVAKALPDVYTLLLTDRGALGINPSLCVKLPYDPLKDFSCIGIATDGPYVLVVNPSLNVSTMSELTGLAN